MGRRMTGLQGSRWLRLCLAYLGGWAPLGLSSGAPTQSLSNKEVSEWLDFHVTQGSQRLRSKQQEEKTTSISRPGPRNWHFLSTIFYWSNSQKAHPDAREGNIHPTSHFREDRETKINHKIDTL